ncbi:hypothetical protein [Proteiniphilum propionicum]|jgi:hypothetical protein|uniref:hypothetical protein n=1 Tax=Proteiniphilum propionicum TaxID=2829812 RepID=UPI001EEA8061|nr:hypothetical protein [Proteiniphilum propionicum]ULB35938.1 hypothetical protein KDN43_07985 [Proteiniphilum propionicum]
METKKNEKAKTIAVKVEEPKRIGKTQSITEILELQLKEIKRKKRLADNRDVFISKSKSLEEYQKQLQQLAIDSLFETEDFKLNFTVKDDYRNSSNFSITNPEMLLKFVVFLSDEIKKAIEKIEKELLQDIA